jgi:hydrophobe/amphiphile efflux-1 (HAE1) family protein
VNVSEPFIRRPVATSLLAVALLLAGMLAYFKLPVAPLPRFDFPTIQVQGSLPGASPETMAAAVATPLERRLGRIAGVTEITSVSTLGATTLTLQFDMNRDVEAAARDVQAAINAAGGELPANMPARPHYRKVNPADAPILIVSLSSDTLPLSKVFDTANTVIAQKISQLDGVGQVHVGGSQQPAVRIRVDPEVLAGMGLSSSDVREAIARATTNQPVGALDGASQSQVIATNDQLHDAAAFKPIVVATKDGVPVRLEDVAHVIDDVENARAAGWFDGGRAVVLVIRRQPGANIIETVERVKALLPKIAGSISPAIKVEVAIDRSRTIRASVHDVEFTLVLSVTLVVLVVFVFLRSLRATAIPSVAVPLSIVATFAGMYLLDYSLDNLSLMALTISTGFVVDDAIVVTENVARLIERGKRPMEAALEGAKQIGFTIVSITTSLLAVFIPLLLMGGVVGRLFRSFAVTLSIAIAISAIVSLTLTPMMCARLLRSEHKRSRGALYRASERAYEGLLAAYEKGLGAVLRHQRLTLFVTALTVLATVGLVVVVPKGLFPQQDGGQLTGFSDAPQDISFAAMKARQEKLNAIVQADPDVLHVVSFLGNQTVNVGSMFIDLKPWPERKVSADQIIARLRPKLAQVQGITLYLQAAQDIRLGGRPTRTQYQYTIQDIDLDELRTWAPKVLAKLRTLPQLKDVASDQQTAGLMLRFTIDRDTASRLGVTPRAIDDALYDAFGQRQIATTYKQMNQYRVVLEASQAYKAGPDALQKVYVRADSGAVVPLTAVGKLTVESSLLSINHQGQFPSVTISFNVAPGAALGPAIEAIRRAEQEIGLPEGVRASFQGTAQAFQSSLDSQPFLIAAALAVVYIVLGMLYESLMHPITILSTLPSAGVGAFAALLVCKTEFSVIALIGIILLIGIVKKNAIMLVDFAIERRREGGATAEQAMAEACRQRFRPILMTTLAALLGALPLALGSGAGSELRRPLGITIVGGLIVSQLLTLYTTPVVYLALDRIADRLSARFSAKSRRVAA